MFTKFSYKSTVHTKKGHCTVYKYSVAMVIATLVTILGTVKKCGAFKICHELPAPKNTDVTIAPGKKQVMYPCVVTVLIYNLF